MNQKLTELATQRLVKILDANYEKANLPELVKNNCTNLNPSEQDKLLEVLKEFKDLFDGTLGVWDIGPVTFELKEGAKPYHGRAYPVPMAQKETIMKEIKKTHGNWGAGVAVIVRMGCTLIYTAKKE